MGGEARSGGAFLLQKSGKYAILDAVSCALAGGRMQCFSERSADW